ncbi:MAG: DNA polymerase III subunit alpha [Solirubrobacterales bacterium]
MFIHLHTHSAFSFLDGGSSVEDLIDRAVELGMPALALTDHDNLCAAVRFQSRARRAGLKPVQGVEATLESGHHLVLLAENPEGYKNLCRILTRAHLAHERRVPRVALDSLKAHCEGLIALTGCRKGAVAAALLARRPDEARRAALQYAEIFGPGNVYLEMQDTYLPGNRSLLQATAALGKETGLPLVATNNVHYARPEAYAVHDILTCVRTLTRVQDVHPSRPLNAENSLKPAEEMCRIFHEYPGAIENTWRIAERCRPAFALDQPYFPEYQPLNGKPAPVFLKELVYRGAVEKYGRLTPAVEGRLDHELHIINTLGYADYFLVVWDMVRFARQEGIRYAGRGSAADSAAAYCLGITEVDALGRGLLFERFMSLERGEKPDIDIDFDSRHRDRVARYVYEKYGRDRVASVCTYNTFRARSAVREIGKALGLPEAELGQLAKKLPHYSQADAIRIMADRLPELRGGEYEQKKYQLLLDLCEKVAGFPRFLGTHLGGLVVSREPLVHLAPLQEAAKGVVITQLDKDDVEDLGLVKLDLLSLRTLGAVDDAVRSINRGGDPFSYDRIPMDDPDTYQMLNSGRTIGVFQLESPAQRALQGRLEASELEDIIASVAIIRPGPIKGNMVEPYIRRRHGLEPVSYPHPLLEPILGKTYGVILFQEQVIEIATAVARFTPGEADALRRVMTHARSHKAMEEIGRQFVAKAAENGVDAGTAETIFQSIAGYASYGFCEAHAAAFATTSFKTAYLLQHYPAYFYAAILSHYPMGYYPPHIICNEARRKGIRIVGPDINRSGEQFEEIPDGSPSGQGIRTSLAVIKKLSRPGLKRILERRPFSSFEDVVFRADLARDELESLIRCGALDGFLNNRRRMLALLPELLEARPAWQAGMGGLFERSGISGRFAGLPDFGEARKYADEFEILGIDVRGHLMERVRADLARMGFQDSREIGEMQERSRVKTAGILFRPHRPPTKSGRITVFLSLEDEFGLTDVTVFEPVYQQYGKAIYTDHGGVLAVSGQVQRRGRVAIVLADELWRMDLTPDFH